MRLLLLIFCHLGLINTSLFAQGNAYVQRHPLAEKIKSRSFQKGDFMAYNLSDSQCVAFGWSKEVAAFQLYYLKPQKKEYQILGNQTYATSEGLTLHFFQHQNSILLLLNTAPHHTYHLFQLKTDAWQYVGEPKLADPENPDSLHRVIAFQQTKAGFILTSRKRQMHFEGQQVNAYNYQGEWNGEAFTEKCYLVLPDANTKTGYIDRSGKMVLAVTSEFKAQFSEGSAPYQFGEQFGYVDTNGTVRIPPLFSAAENFAEGRAIVYQKGAAENRLYESDEKGMYEAPYLPEFAGVIDTSGNFIVPAQYEEIHPYNEGVALFEKAHLYGLLDRAGKEIVPASFETLTPRNNGLIVTADSSNTWNFLDSTMHVVGTYFGPLKEPRFSDDLAAVLTPENQIIYINTQGEQVIDSTFEKGSDAFYNGIAKVKTKRGVFRFIDRQGNFISDTSYVKASAFSEGFAAVQIDGKWGFINDKGELAIPPQYEMAYPFSEGLAAARHGGLWGFINATGNLVIDHQFKRLIPQGGFHCGRCWVSY